MTEAGGLREGSAVYRFGDVTLDLRQMRLWRGGKVVALEPKAFDVLRYLVEHRERLVTKEELLDAVWPEQFVTPNVLTRAVAQLRKGLGDDVREAHTIETAPRRGYRFIATVEVLAPDEPLAAAVDAEASAPASARRESPLGRLRWPLAGAVLAVALALAVREWRRPVPPAPEQPVLTALTTSRGYSGMPALSPDGASIAFVSDRDGSMQIYVTGRAPGSQVVQLTADGGQNVQPAWSPDGQWLAFHSRARGGVWVVPAIGGTSRQVVPVGSDPSWSPDSRRLVFSSDQGGMAAQATLWLVDRDGGDARALTTVGHPVGGHHAPTWSPDGRQIAFSVYSGGSSVATWIVAVADGRLRVVAKNFGTRAASAFSADGSSLYRVSATPRGSQQLYRISLSESRNGSAAGAMLPIGGNTIDGLSIAANGTAALGVANFDSNLWLMPMDSSGVAGEPGRLTDDTGDNTHGSFSPDGARVGFVQFGSSGESTIFSIGVDGSDRELLAHDAAFPQWDPAGSRVLLLRTGGTGGTGGVDWLDLATRRRTAAATLPPGFDRPRLSPDGRRIAFHVVGRDGRMNVWTSGVDGSSARQLTDDPEAITYPVWSPDGRWLAVEIKRGGGTHVGVMAAAGGALRQLTATTGQSWPHSWSPDGEAIAFAGERDGVWNVWQVPRLGGAPQQLTHYTSANGFLHYPQWSPRGDQILFHRAAASGNVWLTHLP